MRVRRRLFLMDAGIACQPAAEILVTARPRSQAGAAEALIQSLVAHHRIFDVLADLYEAIGLVVMSVDIDDEEILITPLLGLLVGVAQERPRIEGFDREIAEIDAVHRHGRLPISAVRRCSAPRSRRAGACPDSTRIARARDRKAAR